MKVFYFSEPNIDSATLKSHPYIDIYTQADKMTEAVKKVNLDTVSDIITTANVDLLLGIENKITRGYRVKYPDRIELIFADSMKDAMEFVGETAIELSLESEYCLNLK